MSEWYNDLGYKDFDGKHVLVTLDDGTTISGAITYDTLGLTAKKEDDTCSGYICMSATAPILIGAYTAPKRLDILVNMEDCRWRPLDGIKSVDLVWDERDWERIDARDVRHGDAVVVNGRLCTVDKAWPGDYHPQVVTDAPGRMLIDLSLVSFALRRKAEVKVPMEPGYYRDCDGGFWKMWLYSEGHAVWQPMLVDIGDTCHMNSTLEMKRLMPLTPVHFESGRAA